MQTELLLSRGDTVTAFESPKADRVKIHWPGSDYLKITVPIGFSAEAFISNFKEILHPDLISHLTKAWPEKDAVKGHGKALKIHPWNEVKIELFPRNEPKRAPKTVIDRPRITIQMGKPVHEFAQDCQRYFQAEFFNHWVSLWTDEDYCRTFEPVGRNLLIRGCV
jgi:hypothetical protein